MNNEEFNTNQSHTNKFIFSDDFYNDIPPEDTKKDITQPVQFQNASNKPTVETESKGFINKMDSNIDQVSGLNDLINSSYTNDDNAFNFFGHNLNINEEKEPAEEIVEQVEIVPEEKETNVYPSKEKTTMFTDLDLRFKKKEVEPNNVVHIETPEVENDFIIDEVKEPEKVEIIEPIIEDVHIENVDTSGINQNLIDNIVEYQNSIEDNKPEQTTSKFIEGATKEEPKQINEVDFMSGNKYSSLDIETGINKELEEELLKQKELEEEEKRKNNQEDYSKYTPLTENTEMVYKAGGKSYIREKKQPEKRIVTSPISQNEEIKEDNNEQLEKQEPQNINDIIDNILNVPNYDEMEVKINLDENPGFRLATKKEEKDIIATEETIVYDEKKDNFNYDQNFDNVEIVKSTLLDELKEKANNENKISILARYGEDFCAKDYITNPAIGRAEEIKQLILILLTPEKSGILTGKPGIGKTSIVEGLAYQLQRNNVPDALKGYRIVSVKTPSLLGSLPTGETRLQTLVDELKEIDKVILFIDEIHMLIGATSESALDFANMFKESLGRGTIKVIGATTTEEYERYILRDKAFVRRFQKVEVEEPDRTHTIKILMGTLPKIEKNTGAKLKYSEFVQTEIMGFIVDITTEYKRIYGIGSRYPDICLTLLAQAFSQAVFANRGEVNIFDIRKAIENSKNIYPDVIKKELINFDIKFKDIINEENRN